MKHARVRAVYFQNNLRGLRGELETRERLIRCSNGKQRSRDPWTVALFGAQQGSLRPNVNTDERVFVCRTLVSILLKFSYSLSLLY